jgi:hypothetical protein
MKSDEIIETVEAEAEKIEAAAKGWFKSFLAWAKSLSWKTKAIAIVSVVIVSGVITGMISASHAPVYVSRSEAYAALALRDASLAALAKRMEAAEAGLHQIQIEMKAVEAKLAEPAKVTTGSIRKSKKRR